MAIINELTRQILWDRLIAAVEEQAQTLIRTAFSTPVREAGDLSAGCFDLRGRMLAQAITGTPGHVNAMAASVGYFLERFPVETLQPGDALITNDPWLGTGHKHDFTVVSPTYFQGRIVGLFASTAHVVDVGGLGFGPDGRQVYEEGLHVPIMKLADRGEINDSLIQIVRVNVREPDQVVGDLYSLAACNDTGSRRLCDMMAEFGLTELDALADDIIERSHVAMLAEIAKLPRGSWQAEMRVDGYDKELDLVCRLTTHDRGISIDWSGTSSVSRLGINVPLTYTQAYSSFGVRCVVGNWIPNNAGSLAAIQVSAPAGSILNAPFPCAVAARHVTGQMLPDVVLGCLEQVLESGVPAEGTSCLWNPLFMGGHGLVDAEYGNATPFTINLFHAGGSGARSGKDGLSATAFPSGVRNTPVEINETISPLIIWTKEYRTDSGGGGRYRGGLGQVMEVEHCQGAPFAISAMFDRCIHPPRGRRGGEAGLVGRVVTDGGTQLRGKGRQTIPAGQRLIIKMPGGGGIGDPKSRDTEMVMHDVLDGLVSIEAARSTYGVAVAADGTVDAVETAALRAGS